MNTHAARVAVACALLALELCAPSPAWAQVNENCTVSVLNRNVRLNADGSWVLPNIPANFGPVRARVTCIVDGQTISGESEPFTVPPNGVVNLPHIVFGQTTPIPTSVTIATPSSPLGQVGATLQLAVTARYSDNTTRDVTAAATGTSYTISNPAIATITADGLVRAVRSGTVLVQATQEGASGITSIQVSLGGADTDGDGIPDDVEVSLGLNPNDPVDAQEDFDRDGLTNLQEWQLGANPRGRDTDGDGLSDGDEVNVHHTNVLLPDTDGDRIPDGVEVQTSTQPLDAGSYNLLAATAESVLTPSGFHLSTSVLFPEASVQLRWQARLIDGRTTLDLTNDPRTTYSSSNLQVCNFGGTAGLVFASSAGSCVVTIAQSTLTVTVPGTVEEFTPSEISSVNVPGAVAVDVAGNFAYVAAGPNGLAVVDLGSRTTPQIVATLPGLGNAQGVRAAGAYVFVADATGFLRVVQVGTPAAPALVASLPIAGAPIAISAHGSLAAVAAGAGGVALVDITSPLAPIHVAIINAPGSAIGVDFDVSRGLAAVAMGTAGLQLVDISSPSAPQLRGRLAGGDVRRVLIKTPSVALLADAQRSVTAVDISNATQPTIASSTPADLGGAPVDIASFGTVAITADITFGAVVPVLSVANPLQPTTVLFWNLVGRGLSSSVAMDPQFGYLIMPDVLRIYRYRAIVDNAGIPPVIEITAPTAGTEVVHASSLTVVAAAIDDVGVAAVDLLVNGQPVLTATAAPYQTTITAPTAGSTLRLGATATDYGGNIGSAADLVLTLIPDPLTTAVGRVLGAGGAPVLGATVTCGGQSGLTSGDGTFNIGGIPTLAPAFSCRVRFVATDGVVLGGARDSLSGVRGGITQVGDITIAPIPIVTSLSRKSALIGEAVPNVATTGHNLQGGTFTFSDAGPSVTGATVDPSGTSAVLSLLAGSRAGTFALVATTSSGTSSPEATPENRFTVVDPGSTADTDGDGVLDVFEALTGTDPLDPASSEDPTRRGSGEVSAQPVSVVNRASPIISQPRLTEVDASTFTVLNLATSTTGQPRSTEVNALPFSVLNLVEMTGGQPLPREVTGAPVSILNEDIAAGPGGQGPGGGTAQPQEADAVFFSVVNLAADAPPGEARRHAHGVLARRDRSPADLPLLGSRPSIDILKTIVIAPECGAVRIATN